MTKEANLIGALFREGVPTPEEFEQLTALAFDAMRGAAAMSRAAGAVAGQLSAAARAASAFRAPLEPPAAKIDREQLAKVGARLLLLSLAPDDARAAALREGSEEARELRETSDHLVRFLRGALAQGAGLSQVAGAITELETIG